MASTYGDFGATYGDFGLGGDGTYGSFGGDQPSTVTPGRITVGVKVVAQLTVSVTSET